MKRNITIEIYQEGNDKITYLDNSIDNVRLFLIQKIKQEYIDNVILSLTNQLMDIEKFPNAVLFLNKNGDSLPLSKENFTLFKSTIK